MVMSLEDDDEVTGTASKVAIARGFQEGDTLGLRSSREPKVLVLCANLRRHVCLGDSAHSTDCNIKKWAWSSGTIAPTCTVPSAETAGSSRNTLPAD
jgi:hypothetical protein